MLQWYKRMTTESRRERGSGRCDVCVCVCKDDTQNQREREKLKQDRERETSDVKQSKISARERELKR